MIRLTWIDIEKAIDNAYRYFKSRGIDVVVGILRGGVVPAIMLSKRLNVDLYVLGVRRYSDLKPPQVISDPGVITCKCIGDVKDKTVLLVDDFANTGITLKLASKILYESRVAKVYTYVVVKRGFAWVDYYSFKFDECVIFPWEYLAIREHKDNIS